MQRWNEQYQPENMLEAKRNLPVPQGYLFAPAEWLFVTLLLTSDAGRPTFKLKKNGI